MNEPETALRPFHAHVTVIICHAAVLAASVAFEWAVSELLFVWLLDVVLISFDALAKAMRWLKHNFRKVWDGGPEPESFFPSILVVLALPIVTLFVIPAYADWASSDAPRPEDFFADPGFWTDWCIRHLQESPSLWIGLIALALMHVVIFWVVFIKLKGWEDFDPNSLAKRPVLHVMAMIVLFLVTPFIAAKLFGAVDRAALVLPISLKLAMDLVVVGISIRRMNR